MRLAWLDSPVGRLLAGVSDGALRLLEFSDPNTQSQQLESARRRLSADVRNETDPCIAESALLERVRDQLAEYFAGARKTFDVPLETPGTEFQVRVWSVLRTIGYAQTISYLEQARRVGDEKAVRAVAQANGQNPIAILVPCHRVINASGEMGGYGGGLLRKQYLLDLERGDRLL